MAEQAPPPWVLAAAAERDLGAFESAHRSIRVLQLIGPLALLALIVVIFSSSAGAVVETLSIAIVVVILAAVLAIGLLNGRRLYLFAGGIVTDGPRAKHRNTLAWADVSHIAIYLSRAPLYLLVLANGGTVTVGYFFRNSSQVVQAVEDRVCPRLLQESLAAVESTGIAEFGSLRAERAGLASDTGEHLVAWQDISKFLVEDNQLKVYSAQKRLLPVALASLRELRDLPVLMSVITHFTQKAGPPLRREGLWARWFSTARSRPAS
ncbi:MULTISPECIES: DUF6585 family protein [Pseudofrankia]|uniref:DUF6585 family protein n=1 Tax=Pseudofrankia TaxID=2994363 RepID=UPI000234B2BA|nr:MULTISPECIES: DUF6585 family protein [Pseudofrankia]OHV36941.1 hypothetical protein BCD49_16850 [Pseudofrankia sp. EUN1h]